MLYWVTPWSVFSYWARDLTVAFFLLNYYFSYSLQSGLWERRLIESDFRMFRAGDEKSANSQKRTSLPSCILTYLSFGSAGVQQSRSRLDLCYWIAQDVKSEEGTRILTARGPSPSCTSPPFIIYMYVYTYNWSVMVLRWSVQMPTRKWYL